MNNPDVSVILLTYNQEATISRAIESILAQEAAPYRFEIVIGDDASTDSTRSICERYRLRYPHIVRLMPELPNKGVVSNYFDTLSECRGRYIADCAGDDYWLDPTRLMRQAALLDVHPDVAITHGAWNEVTIDGTTIAHRRPYGMADTDTIVDGKDLLEPLLAHKMPLPLHLSTAMYRRSVAHHALDSNRLIVDNPAFQCEDLPLTAALLASGRVAYEPATMLAYTVGESTVSNPHNLEKALGYFSATMRCTSVLANHYGISSGALDHYFKSRAIHIAKLARRIATPAARQQVIETMKAVGRPLPWQARLISLFAPESRAE